MLSTYTSHSATRDYRSAALTTATHIQGQLPSNGLPKISFLDDIQEGLNTLFPRFDMAGNDFYPIASDTGFENTLQYCSQIEPLSCDANNAERVGLIVGDSFLLSSLPVFKKHADSIIVADYNPRMLDMIHFKLEMIRISPTREDFLKRLLCEDNPFLESLPKPYRGNLDNQSYQKLRTQAFQAGLAKKLPNLSFLLTGEHYEKARHNARNTPVRFVCIDLFNPEESDKLGKFISERLGHITLLNATNLFDYRVDREIRYTPKHQLIDNSIRRTDNFISNLPLHKNPLVLYSLFVKYGRSNAAQPGCGSFVARSTQEYFQANRTAAEKW
jgi:hypothetical protein